MMRPGWWVFLGVKFQEVPQNVLKLSKLENNLIYAKPEKVLR
jgi:hypothetical protein